MEKKCFTFKLGSERFSQKAYLKIYMCIVTIKKHIEGFPQKSYLNHHLNIHTEDKPYVCNTCNQGLSKK